jgi:hypothetical protein
MYKAPSIEQPRRVFDSHGHMLGECDGFRPDPATGGLGIEIEFEDEARSLLDTDLRRAWLSADDVRNVRPDRMILALTLRELRLVLHERSLWAEGTQLDPEHVRARE